MPPRAHERERLQAVEAGKLIVREDEVVLGREAIDEVAPVGDHLPLGVESGPLELPQHELRVRRVVFEREDAQPQR